MSTTSGWNPDKYKAIYLHSNPAGNEPLTVEYANAHPQRNAGGLNQTNTLMLPSEILHATGGFYPNHFQEPWQNFDRYYTANPDIDDISSNRQYIFIVRPECNLVAENNSILPELRNDPFISYMMGSHKIVARQLTMKLTPAHDFMPFLVGRTESLQIPDYSIKNYMLTQPYSHYAMPYGGSGIESQTGGTFDITFRDDAQFRVHKLFQLWLYYIDGVVRNKFPPLDKFIRYNKIDYACSIYQFIVSVDGTTILWWSKYTGCVPTSVPNSDLSWNLGGRYDGRLNIPFAFFHHEALNPHIFADFNRNSSGAMVPTTDYDDMMYTMGGSYVGAPYVDYSNPIVPTLKWRKPLGPSSSPSYSGTYYD